MAMVMREIELVPLAQRIEINTLGGDVLAHFPREDGHVVVAAESRVEQGFEGEEVDLFEIWGEGGFAGVISVLDGGAAVGVGLDAEGGQEEDGGLGCLGEGVGWGEVGGVDGHCGILVGRC